MGLEDDQRMDKQQTENGDRNRNKKRTRPAKLKLYVTQRDVEDRHKTVVQRKYEKIAMYNAIIDAWEQSGKEPDDEYLKEVRKKLHSAETQLKNMKWWQ